MKGKDKCKALKEIRKQIAETNNIPYITEQCNYKGECTGTCPKCEAELAYLERELRIKESLGKAVAIAGISASLVTGLAACGTTSTTTEANTSDIINAIDKSNKEISTTDITDPLMNQLYEVDAPTLTSGIVGPSPEQTILDKILGIFK